MFIIIEQEHADKGGVGSNYEKLNIPVMTPAMMHSNRHMHHNQMCAI